MSGVAGASRIKSRTDFMQFVLSYMNLISNFPGFVSCRPSGSFNSDPSKEEFGDIDLIVTISSVKDKPAVKLELKSFLQAQPSSVIVPFTSKKYAGQRVHNSGELLSVNYFDKKLGYSVQIDNIIALSQEEATFKQQFLNWSAEKQGLILGLTKIATIETPPAALFNALNIHAPAKLPPNQEYEFNLSSLELQLRRVKYQPGTYKEVNREIIWRSKDFNLLQKLLYQYDLTSDFESLLEMTKETIKNPRSVRRILGVFSAVITVKSGEVGTLKGASKEEALQRLKTVLQK